MSFVRPAPTPAPRNGHAPQPARTGTDFGLGTPMRKLEVSSLDSNGEIRRTHHLAPAIPLFEDAVTALARGALMATSQGPVAIEDLLPGDHLVTEEYGALPIVWIGSTTLHPAQPAAAETPRLLRVTADAFGIRCPETDLLVGSGARLRHVPSGALEVSHTGHILTPLRDFADGTQVIEITPPSPVQLFHIALPRHATIRAGGLALETYHPGRHPLDGVGKNMQALYLSLFPHIETPSDFGGLTHPRISLEALENLLVG